MNLMTIPEVRAELLAVANTLEDWHNLHGYARVIRTLEKHLHRRKAVRRARPKATTMTPALGDEIWDYAVSRPSASYKDISQWFNVSIGRVSEVLAGKRGE